MEKKQTAVKWLVQQIYGDMWTQDEDIEKLVHKAKEMERQQIIHVAKYHFHENGNITPEEIYNNKFGK